MFARSAACRAAARVLVLALGLGDALVHLQHKAKNPAARSRRAPHQRRKSRHRVVRHLIPAEYAAELATTAAVLVAPGKGILATDESLATLNARFVTAEIEPDESLRRSYRELIYTTPDLGKYVSGVILSPDMLYCETAEGKPFVDVLENAGVVPGVRVDAGEYPLPGAMPGETFSRGLDTLVDRATTFREQGARFAKWRARFRIGADGKAPSQLAVKENCWALARAARTLQEVGLVPLLEPTVLVDGEHTIERAAEVQERVYNSVFRALSENGVFLEGALLKPSMTTPGVDCVEEVKPEVIAAYSVRTLERTVPSAVAGVTFNSGGLSEEEASLCLDAMNRIERKGPWSVTFGFASSLQQSCLKEWAGNADNVPKAQAALLARCKANGQANLGKYVPGSQPTSDETVGLRGFEKARQA